MTVVITIGTAITSIVLHRLLYRWPCVPRINRRFSLSFDGYLLTICATVMVERWPSEPYVRLDAVFSSLVRNILPSTCTRREERTRSPRSNSSVQGPSSNSILWESARTLSSRLSPPFCVASPLPGPFRGTGRPVPSKGKVVRKSADVYTRSWSFHIFDRPFEFSPLIPFRTPKESVSQPTTMT